MEEARRVHSVGDSAANEGEPVEDHGRLARVLGEQLADNIEANRDSKERRESNTNLLSHRKRLILLRERVTRELLNDTHDC